MTAPATRARPARPALAAPAAARARGHGARGSSIFWALSRRVGVSTFHWVSFACNLSLNFFGTDCAQVFNFRACPNVRNPHGSVGNIDSRNSQLTLLFTNYYIPPPEPCALHIFRHQSNFLSAPQSVSRNFLETDW
eukprot:COSAG02_NODE_6849_length_3328_cov_35.645401_1_plen_135_part_10